MKTILLAGALVSIFIWSRNVNTDSNYPTPIKVYGKMIPSFDYEEKKNDPHYRDLVNPNDNFKTLFAKQNRAKGDGC